MLSNLKYVVNQEMFKEKQSIPGRNVCQRLFRVTQKITSIKWMRQVYFGMLYLIGGLARKAEVVREERKVSIDSPLHFLFQHQVKRKSHSLFGNPKIPGVCGGLTNHLCLSFIYYSQNKAWMTGDIMKSVLQN